MKKCLSLILITLILAGNSFAQRYLPDNFFYKTLPNGLEILVIEDKNVPLVTIELALKNGAFTEPPELDGLSHLYEHMFFKANRDYPSQEAFLERAEELGIVFNGTTSNERVNYFITLGKHNLKKGMDFMNSAIRYPLFLQDEMTRENPVVAGEFQRMESDPFSQLYLETMHRAWENLASRKNAIGNYDIIYSATTEKMKTIQERYYYPNNTLLAVAGDVNHKEIFEMAAKVFGDWEKSTFNPFDRWPIPEILPFESAIQFVKESPIAQTPIFFTIYQGPDTRRDLPGTYAADVFSYCLNQKSSRLKEKLVETGLAYDVEISYSTLKYTGEIYIILVPNPTRLQEAWQTLQDEIALWDSEDYLTDEQIETAKKMLTIEGIYRSEKTSEYVHLVTYYWASASIDYYTTFYDKLKAVERSQIQDYVRKYLKGKPSVTGLLIHPDMREALGIDTIFPETYNDMSAYRFNFIRNTGEFADSLSPQRLNSLIAWAKANPEKRLRINGYAEKKEYHNIRDKEMLNFLKSLEQFRKYPGKELLPKKHIRLDLYRAFVIVKALMDAGVEEKRLTGSGTIETAKEGDPAEMFYKVEPMIIKR